MLKFLQEKISWSIVYPEQNFGLDCGYKNKKYDCVILSKMSKYVIVIECDERWHSSPSYTETCEWSRPFAAYDIFEKPVLFIRWNPDSFKVNGINIRVTKQEKMEVLWEYVKPYITEEKELEEKVKVSFVYYPMTSEKDITGDISPIYEYTTDELDQKIKMFFVS